MASTNINIRMDSDLKMQFEAFCADMGMTMTAAINIFAKKAVREYRIPFEIGGEVPNAVTRKAIEDAENGIGMSRSFSSVKDLMEDLNADNQDDKGSSYDEWLNAFDGKVRYLVLIGQTRDKIKEAAERLGVCPCILCENLEEAVKVCAEKANPGDAVLLSPACASWGQFDNYEQRGDMFKEYVRNL